ncbi:hypothetical protein pb186bvf_005333 [Paramecium bursaria]
MRKSWMRISHPYQSSDIPQIRYLIMNTTQSLIISSPRQTLMLRKKEDLIYHHTSLGGKKVQLVYRNSLNSWTKLNPIIIVKVCCHKTEKLINYQVNEKVLKSKSIASIIINIINSIVKQLSKTQQVCEKDQVNLLSDIILKHSESVKDSQNEDDTSTYTRKKISDTDRKEPIQGWGNIKLFPTKLPSCKNFVSKF